MKGKHPSLGGLPERDIHPSHSDDELGEKSGQ